MKKLWYLFVFIIFAFIVSGCSGSSQEAGISEDGILELGEIGLYKSNKGDFEIVIDSVKYEVGEGAEKSKRGIYLVASATVTSKSSKVVNVEDILPFKIYIDDVINWNNVTYGKEFSFGGQISGELKEGESISGNIIFDTRESETYTILLGQKTDQNKLEWEITSDKVQK